MRSRSGTSARFRGSREEKEVGAAVEERSPETVRSQRQSRRRRIGDVEKEMETMETERRERRGCLRGSRGLLVSFYPPCAVCANENKMGRAHITKPKPSLQLRAQQNRPGLTGQRVKKSPAQAKPHSSPMIKAH